MKQNGMHMDDLQLLLRPKDAGNMFSEGNLMVKIDIVDAQNIERSRK